MMNIPEETSIIKEYRIVMPLSLEEYRIGQLYGVAEASKNETGGGEGIEVVTNEPREEALDGILYKSQYTHKLFHLKTKVPAFIRILAPTGSLTVHERAYNAYPYCITKYSNDYMKDAFHIFIETRYAEGNGEIENIHNLSEGELSKRTVDRIDIVTDRCDSRDYKESEDPSKFKSEKTGRGPLIGEGWEKNMQPLMCCYKLYRVEFKWWGLQTRVEKIILRAVRRLLYNFHRQVFCWMDKWHGMTIEDIRELEEKTKKDLDEMRNIGSVKGMTEK